MKYRSGYRYQLAEDEVTKTDILQSQTIRTEFMSLFPDGTLVISRGYAWDGPSGPALDTPSFMRGSLIHDALYQLLRMELLEPHWREVADEELVRVCKEDGMGWFRRWYVKRGLKRFGGPAADPRNKKPILTAP